MDFDAKGMVIKRGHRIGLNHRCHTCEQTPQGCGGEGPQGLGFRVQRFKNQGLGGTG